MGYLRQRAERFRKQERLRKEDLESIIEEMKEKMGATDIGEEEKEANRLDKHQQVMEAVNEGLIQMHRIAPNTKQDRVFWIMCENANGFNNMISGNTKIA